MLYICITLFGLSVLCDIAFYIYSYITGAKNALVDAFSSFVGSCSDSIKKNNEKISKILDDLR